MGTGAAIRTEVSTDPGSTPTGGAPNVLVVLLDDVGFGASSVFGGPCQTPVAERLAGNGLRHKPVSHDRAVCPGTGGASDGSQSPLGGDGDHHRGGDVGARVRVAAAQHEGAAGGDAEAQRLLDGAVGKCHEVAQFQNAPMIGPFDTWPTFAGFEYYYGFIGAETTSGLRG